MVLRTSIVIFGMDSQLPLQHSELLVHGCPSELHWLSSPLSIALGAAAAKVTKARAMKTVDLKNRII